VIFSTWTPLLLDKALALVALGRDTGDGVCLLGEHFLVGVLLPLLGHGDGGLLAERSGEESNGNADADDEGRAKDDLGGVARGLGVAAVCEEERRLLLVERELLPVTLEDLDELGMVGLLGLGRQRGPLGLEVLERDLDLRECEQNSFIEKKRGLFRPRVPWSPTQRTTTARVRRQPVRGGGQRSGGGRSEASLFRFKPVKKTRQTKAVKTKKRRHGSW